MGATAAQSVAAYLTGSAAAPRPLSSIDHSVAQRVLEFLALNGTSDVAAIAVGIGVSEPVAVAALAQLSERRVVRLREQDDRTLAELPR